MVIDSFPLNLSDSFTHALACASLSPGLRSILVFDISPVALQQVAQTLSAMLKTVTGWEIVPVSLGTFESEDDLWGCLGLWSESEKQPLHWQSGLLGGGQKGSQLRLVVIPDLTKLSLAASRACVMLMGADVTHLERYGQHQHWRPKFCWLAGCLRTEVGMVSPHLLDRFALRLSGQIGETSDRVQEILEWFKKDEELGERISLDPIVLHSDLQKKLTQAKQQHSNLTPEAIERVFAYISDQEVYSLRREIALTRLSSAIAQLEGFDNIIVNHVDTAATIIGLKLPETPDPMLSNSDKSPTTIDSSSIQKSPKESTNRFTDSQSINTPVYQSEEREALDEVSLILKTTTINPYPEDKAPVEREANSLKLPTRHFSAKVFPRGIIIGVEKATTPQDLAIVRTILEAAKFKNIRQKNRRDKQGNLKISSKDWYRYRRIPVAEQMLLLVLDHTCLDECKWQESLLPYLSWAYVERASICLIQVGAANAQDELRAEKITARSLLVPQISAALEAAKGRTTPLAHGLNLALQTLRHALQHGRNLVRKAVLVVISDGRGNVPLEASHLGRIRTPVGRKGIDDALLVSEQIDGLNHVESVILNPQPKQYPELPLLLAQKIGAKVVLIPSLETWKAEETWELEETWEVEE
jgi:magnesium chelatase subunit D